MTDTARYTHGHHDSVLQSHRWRTVDNSAAYLVPWLEPGRSLLDVGCGPGTITVDLGRRLSPGTVLGIDPASGVIDEARSQPDIPANVRFEVADLHQVESQLGLGAGRFDIVHAHQVLQHLSDPVGALRAMRRLCAPGGVVAVRDAEYASMLHYPADPELGRWLEAYHRVSRANGGEPDAGRRLLHWAHQAGFNEVSPSASAWCFATEEDRRWWGGLWAQRTTESSLADRAVELGICQRADLEGFAAAWLRWADDPSGWFAMLHGEVLCRG